MLCKRVKRIEKTGKEGITREKEGIKREIKKYIWENRRNFMYGGKN